MARKMCTDCNTRPRSAEAGSELCDPCLTYAEAENGHSDSSHDAVTAGETGLGDGWVFTTQAQLDTFLADVAVDMARCPVCHPELDPRFAITRTGHRNTAAGSWNSHAGHDHPTTPSARAACRKANRPVV